MTCVNHQVSEIALLPGGPYLSSVTNRDLMQLPDVLVPTRAPDHGVRYPQVIGGAAVDDVPTRASRRAYGEMHERLALRRPDSGRLRLSSRDALDGDCIDASDVLAVTPRGGHALALPSEAQQWVRGVRVGDGDPVWVSAEMVWPGLARPDGSTAWDWTTIGTGAGLSPQMAMDSAISELRERDYLMRSWRGSTIALPLSQKDVIESVSQSYVNLLKHQDLQSSGLLIPSMERDFFVSAVLLSNRDGAQLSLGTGRSMSMKAAVSAALAEAIHSRTTTAKELQRGVNVIANEESPESFTHRRRLLWNSHRDSLKSWLTGGAQSTIRRDALKLQSFTCVDITTPEAEAEGYYIARAIGVGLELMDERHLCRLPFAREYPNDKPHPFG